MSNYTARVHFLQMTDPTNWPEGVGQEWKDAMQLVHEGVMEFWDELERTEFQELQEEDILLEALRITSGDRQHQYGPPDQDFVRIAKLWSALKGVEFESRDVAMFMICVKLSREVHQRKRDNAVDLAGYARCLHICNQSKP